MATTVITDRPAQIIQSLMGPVLLANNGSETVYLGDNTNVSSTFFDVALSPGQSLNTNGSIDLWAATAPGLTSSVSILGNANGVLLSSIQVHGNVNIGQPVNVQGGGETLFDDAVFLDESTSLFWFKWVYVPAPPSGLTYYGLRIYLNVLTPGPVFWQVGSPEWMRGTLYRSASNEFRTACEHRFVLPFIGNYPVPIMLSTPIANPGMAVTVRVEGISAAIPHPTTDLSVPLSTFESPSSGFAQGQAIYLPASFDPYKVILMSNVGSGGNIVNSTYYELSLDYAMNWVPVVYRPHIPTTYALATNSTLPQANRAEFLVGGSGRVGRFIASAANNNFTVSIQKV